MPIDLILSRSEAKAASIPFYFTGKPCKHGHITPRRVDNCGCIKCLKEWRINNREAEKAMGREWRKNNPEKRKVALREWYEKNRKAHLAASRKWKKENPEKYKALMHQWYEKNKETVRNAKRRWKKENPEAVKAMGHALRSRRRKAQGKFVAADIERILKQQKRKCAYFIICRRSIPPYHIDHIVPLSAPEGTNWPRNIQLLCADCNTKKSNHDQIEYMQRNGNLL